MIVAYEISKDCKVINLRSIIEDRAFEAQDTSPFFTQRHVFAHVKGMRRPLRERTIDLIGEKYEGKQLRCRVDAMDNVVSAWIAQPTSEYGLGNEDRRRVELEDGKLPDFGTLSKRGEVQGACNH